MTTTTNPAEVAEIINPDCVYTPRELAARIGGERSTILEWGRRKEEPLPILREKPASKIMLIKGRDFIDWFEKNAKSAQK